ncbi:MAG: DUF4174 domain-containing protein [Pseudomonadota bacterium]
MSMTAILIAGSMSIGPVDAPSLEGFRWEYRPIVIFADEDDPRLEEQLDLLEAAEPELIDRDNLVVLDTAPASPLRDRFSPGEFTVILVGLDGGEKFRRDGLVRPGELNALIDTMPMRRNEMRTQGGNSR